MTSASRHRASLLVTCLLLNVLAEARKAKPPTSGLRQNAASLRAKRNHDGTSGGQLKTVRAGAQDLRAKRAEKEKNGAADALPVAGNKKRDKVMDTSTSRKGRDKKKDASAAPKRKQKRYASKTPAPIDASATYTPTTSTTSSSITTTNASKTASTTSAEPPTNAPTKLGGATSVGSTDQPTWWSAGPPYWGAWKDNNMLNYSTMSKTYKGGKGSKSMHHTKSGKSKAGKASGKSSKSKSAKLTMDDWYYDDDSYGDDYYDDWQPAVPPQEYWVPGMNGPSMGNGGRPNDGAWGGGMKPHEGDMQGQPGWSGGELPDAGSKPGWGGSSNGSETGSKPGWGGSGKPGGGSQGGSWGSVGWNSWGGGNQGGSWGGSNKPGWGGSWWGSGWWGGWGGHESYPPFGSVAPVPNQPLFPPTPAPFSTVKPSPQLTEGIPTYSPSNPLPTYAPSPSGSTLAPTPGASTYPPTPGASTYPPTPGASTIEPTEGGIPTFSPSDIATEGGGLPTFSPSVTPTIGTETVTPTSGVMPTFSPTGVPSISDETGVPTGMPSFSPTNATGTVLPTVSPTMNATMSQFPSAAPSNGTYAPSFSPTMGEFIFPKLDTILSPNEDVDEGAFFGSSVGVDRRTIVVGIQEDDNGVGSAIVYRYDNANRTFFEEAKLTPSNGEPTDDFGRAVAISDDFVIVGAQKNDEAGIDSGAAYIYMRSQIERVDAEWEQVAILTPPDAQENERFGISVAINKNVAIIGANGADQNGENSGAAYIFTLVDDEWVFTQKLVAPDGEAGDNFGFSVAIYGDQAVVGAVWDGEKSGSVYVYILNRGVWTVEGKFVADGGNPDDQFGWSVAMWEHTIAVGAFADDTSGLDSGAVYIFEKDPDEVWYQQARVTASDGEDNDHFGRSVDIHGDWLIVSSPFDDEAGIEAGSVYIYQRDDDDWLLQNKLFSQIDPTDFNEFGFSVAVSDDFFVASSKLENETLSDAVGNVYVYNTYIPGEPTGSPTTTPYPTTATPTFNPTISYRPSFSQGPSITPQPTNSSMPSIKTTSEMPSMSPTNMTVTDTPTTSPTSEIPTFSPTSSGSTGTPTTLTEPTEGPTPFTSPPIATSSTAAPTPFTMPPASPSATEPPATGTSFPTTYFPTTLEPGSGPPVASSGGPTPFSSPPIVTGSSAFPTPFTMPPGSNPLPTLPPESPIGTGPPAANSLPTLPPQSSTGMLPTMPPAASLGTGPPASNSLPTLPPQSGTGMLPTMPPAASLGSLPTPFPTFGSVLRTRTESLQEPSYFPTTNWPTTAL